MRENAFSRLTPSEIRFLEEWNDTRQPYPREETIPALFEQEVLRSPGAVALVSASGREALTYAEVNARANRLAHHLRGLGVGPDVLVAIELERSLDAIVAMLGVLKSGGAYVPVDPMLPLERLSTLLEDARPAVVVTREELADALPSNWAQLVCLDADGESIARQSDENPIRVGSASSLAYVLYTSGSTGVPKGVAVVHRGVVRLVRGTRYARFGPNEVFLQAAPLSFDASTFEIWGALLNGGRLIVLPAPTPGLDDLAEAIRRHHVTTLWLTAGLFHLAVEERLSDLRSLRQLLAGGDVLSPARVRTALRELPGCVLINGYGPTESTTFAACHRIRHLDENTATVPIGRPIANTQIYLLDSEQRWVPPGEVGEVYIGGDGLARGYWNRLQLTAEAFVESPFSADPSARLYRTGDLARLLPDGNLEFVGRLDRQIKIHGYRVELGEIETMLQRRPSVAQNVVACRETPDGSRRVVAYVVLRPGMEAGGDELRAWLQQRLPDYMVPTVVARLSSLPLTPNGKLDRKALPEPERFASRTLAPPRSPMEEQIADIWRAVLRTDEVGCEENFFDLGGDSLLLIEAHAKLQKRLAVGLPITKLFEHPTVQSLARFLRESSDPEEPLRALRERVWRKRRPPDRGQARESGP